MALSDHQTREVIERVQAAAFEPEAWEDALPQLAIIGGGWGAQLIGVSTTQGLLFNVAAGIPTDALRAFELGGGADPAVNPRVFGLLSRALARHDSVELAVDESLISERDQRSNRFYREFLWRYDAPHFASAFWSTREDVRCSIAVSRSRRQGPAGQLDLASLGFLADHVRRAVDLQQNLERQGALIAAQALDLASVSAFMCDYWGRVVSLSVVAEEAVRRSDFIRLKNGKLCAASASSDVELQDAIARVSRRGPLGELPLSRTVLLRNAGGDLRRADVAPTPLHRHALRFGAVFMVILRERSEGPGAADLLRRAYSVTSAEAAIAVALVRGTRPAEIAAQRGVSIETVRNQIRSLFLKVGVNSQSALTRAITALTGLGP